MCKSNDDLLSDLISGFDVAPRPRDLDRQRARVDREQQLARASWWSLTSVALDCVTPETWADSTQVASPLLMVWKR